MTLRVLGGTPVRDKGYPAWPQYDERDEEALIRVLRSRRWGGYPYPGPETSGFLEAFLEFQGGEHAIACANGTVTMEIALRAAGIGWRDEVVVPAYTFQATAVAVLAVGATPVLADVEARNYCLDPAALKAAITRRTRAVMVVHVASHMADMDAISEVAKQHGLVLIEDAAHAHGARWKGKGAGTFGAFGSFSLQSTKVLTTGEGGLLICQTAEFADRAASIADNGRAYLAGGRVRGGSRHEMGTNQRMTEFQAALGRVALERLPAQTSMREQAAALLDERLAAVPGVRVLPRDERQTRRAVFGYVFAMDPAVFGFDHRVLCHLLNAEGIPCWKGYAPLHRDELYAPHRTALPLAREHPSEVDYTRCSLPNSEAAGEDAVWLYERVFRDGAAGVDDVIRALLEIHAHRALIIPRRHEFTAEWTAPGS